MKEIAQEGEIGLYYLDESGFSNIPEVQRAWSPVAEPHEADATVGRARVNVLGALDFAQSKLMFEVYEHSLKEVDVVTFLDQLAERCHKDRLNFCVLDNASIHRYIDDETRDRWLANRLVLFFIPPYSPELNLIEILWKHAKYHWREFVSWHKSQLGTAVQSLLGAFGEKFNISFR